MAELTPRQIVRELDRYIVGQDEAKRIMRFLMTGLLVSGCELSDGRVIEPSVPPVGERTTEDMYK